MRAKVTAIAFRTRRSRLIQFRTVRRAASIYRRAAIQQRMIPGITRQFTQFNRAVRTTQSWRATAILDVIAAILGQTALAVRASTPGDDAVP